MPLQGNRWRLGPSLLQVRRGGRLRHHQATSGYGRRQPEPRIPDLPRRRARWLGCGASPACTPGRLMCARRHPYRGRLARVCHVADRRGITPASVDARLPEASAHGNGLNWRPGAARLDQPPLAETHRGPARRLRPRRQGRSSRHFGRLPQVRGPLCLRAIPLPPARPPGPGAAACQPPSPARCWCHARLPAAHPVRLD